MSSVPGARAAVNEPDILAKLREVTRTSSGWTASCPAHDDDRPSLSVAVGDDGRALVHCFAGCETDAVLKAVDMTFKDLAPGRREVAAYPYHDEHGRLVYEIVRCEPKEFRMRRPDGQGGWIWSLKGIQRVMYRFPDLHGYTRVYFVEGEKDANALVALGLPATTTAGGVTGWRDKYADQLVAAGVEEVIVLPDNDDPGREYATKVAAALRSRGITVGIVALPGLPAGGDVSDWLAAGGDRLKLKQLAEDALTPPEAATAPEVPKIGRTVVVVLASEIEPKHVDWIWPGRLAVGMLTNVVGLPKQGKGLFFTDIAARITHGAVMPPSPITARSNFTEPGRVLIITGEDSAETTTVPRLLAAGADRSRIGLLIMVREPDGSQSVLTLERDVAVLEQELARIPYRLVIIDGLAGYLGKAKTHVDADVRRVLMPFTALLDRLKVAGLSVMHPPKSVTNLSYLAGGSVAFTAIPRCNLLITTDPSDDEETQRRRKVLVTQDGNLHGPVDQLAFSIVVGTDAGVPRLEYETGAVHVNVGASMAPPRPQRDQEREEHDREVEEWLRGQLADGPKPSREVEAEAKEAGMGRDSRALQRAKDKVARSIKVGERWCWVLR